MRPFPLAFKLSLAILLLLLPAIAAGQSPGAQPAPSKVSPKDDAAALAQEGSIVEDLRLKGRFENDGRESFETTARVKIQSEAAVREDGILAFSYSSSTEAFEIKYVRVRKPDGSVVETPLDTAQDVSSDVARAAPMYTDEHEKHVPVRGLAVGDTLEYQTVSNVHTPFAPGQFWFSHYFAKQGITRHESLEINVPKNRDVKVVSPGIAPAISEQGDRRIYTFETSHLKKDPEKNRFQAVLDGTPRPDVLVSSFKSWDQVAAWYASLQNSKLEVTPEIRAKAEELTRGKTSDIEKIQAIYDYVSLRFRYIAIMLGQGRYMPHGASAVLGNGFGDCKDKHTLLAALLKAVKIDVYPALIGSSIKLDPDTPTPALFDHVISVVPQGDSYIWLDTTPGSAPFRLILYGLRKKLALVVLNDGKGKLLTTPADPPFPDSQHFSMTATLDKSGTLDGKASLEVRGDLEVVVREAFRNLARPQWKQLAQNISNSMGFGGTVDDVAIGPLDDARSAFWMTYNYHRQEYGDWENHRIILPFPFFGLPTLSKEDEAKSSTPVPLGPPQEIDYDAHVTLPDGLFPEVPGRVQKKNDFAEYDAAYTLKGSVFEGTRHLRIGAERVPADKLSTYSDFYKLIDEEQRRWIVLGESTSAGGLHSANPEVQKLLDEAYQSLQMGSPHAAIKSMEEALKLEPDLPDAWLLMATARSMNRQIDACLAAIRKAISLDPSNIRAQSLLAETLAHNHQEKEAIVAWRDLLKMKPDDRNATSELAILLVTSGKLNEARPLLEKLVESSPDATVCIQLAQTYLDLKENDKARAQLQKAIELSPDPATLNTAAYILTEANLHLPKALGYVERAIHDTEAATSADSTPRYDLMNELAGEWDTIGWIYFRQNQLPQAQRYLSAAWNLWHAETIGDHLGQVYEKMGERKRALHIYALTLATIRPDTNEPLRKRLTAKIAASGAPAPKWSDSIDELQKMRTFHLKPIGSREGSADFMVALTKGPKVEEVKFLNGADELNNAGPAIAELRFQPEFPDDGPTRIVFRGLLNCSPARGDCMFVMMEGDAPRPPASSNVH